MEYGRKPRSIEPRIIIHGGAGNISRENLTREAYGAYRKALLGILDNASKALAKHGATSLDVATYAVSLLENDPLFNAGHGAVYTTAETHELEASVMVSNGFRKRGVGVMKVTRAKHPILLAKEMLIRGERDDGGGAGGHCQLAGETCDALAEQWGLELVQPSYFWTRRRWDEHRRGLRLPADDETYAKHKKAADGDKRSDAPSNDSAAEACFDVASDPTWDGKEYLPQGTVGCVVLDSTGTICAATSTGGLTNKLPGRIGDTPTLGAGFWAEEWYNKRPAVSPSTGSPTRRLCSILGDCLPALQGYSPIGLPRPDEPDQWDTRRAVGMSGTGNGDSFLRVNAVRTAAAIARFMPNTPVAGQIPLLDAITAVAGPGGMLQQSAEDRWKKTGEGEGGIIGIDYKEGAGKVVAEFNCGGMFRAWVDDQGQQQMAVFRDFY